MTCNIKLMKSKKVPWVLLLPLCGKFVGLWWEEKGCCLDRELDREPHYIPQLLITALSDYFSILGGSAYQLLMQMSF